MPKKLKLNLNELKVQSFITTLNDAERNMLRGGGSEEQVSCTGPDCVESCTCPTDCSCATCPPICTNTGGGCTGLPICCN